MSERWNEKERNRERGRERERGERKMDGEGERRVKDREIESGREHPFNNR